jgi:hypothetical protein
MGAQMSEESLRSSFWDRAFVPFGSAVLGTAIGLVGGLLGAKASSEGSANLALREQRTDAYLEFQETV